MEAGEVGGSFIVLVLRPSLEGMVVALVAVETGRQEEMGRVLHGSLRSPQDLVVGGGRIRLVRTARGQDLSDEIVVP